MAWIYLLTAGALETGTGGLFARGLPHTPLGSVIGLKFVASE